MKRLTSNVIGDDGRAYSSLLGSSRVLKGPIELGLESGRVRKPVSWLPPPDDNAASTSPPPASPGPSGDSESSPGQNVTHGMALIVRLIDDAGRMLPGKDQVIWLIPMPWPAESYVKLEKIKYEQGQIQITADLRSELDGDDKVDEIPEIVKTPVTVQWTLNDQWESFRQGQTTQPDSRPIQLKQGLPNRGQIEVAVARNRETLIQLDVDGWPRAILRSIAQREGAVAKKRNRFEQLRFASVAIGYGDTAPTNSKSDDKLGPQQVYSPDPDESVIFRGRGKSLATRLIADLTPVSFRKSPPPEIRVFEGGSLGARFWTDRSVRTMATEVKDNGTIELLTTVKDLSVSWNSKATKADADLQFRSEMNVEGDNKVASMQVTLDSTPPVIEEFRRNPGRLYVGQKIKYVIAGTDPAGVAGGNSGLDRVVVGIDADKDGKPDNIEKSYPFQSGKYLKEFTAATPGRHQIVAQIWDKAGFASKTRADVLSIYERPKPKKKTPKPAPPTPSAPAVPAKPPKPKVAKRGPLEGRIDIGSTLRGTLTLSPVPDEKISPKNGELDISGSRPTFSFGNVPEGEYSLSFKGTMQGSSKTFTWGGLNIGKKHVLPAN